LHQNIALNIFPKQARTGLKQIFENFFVEILAEITVVSDAGSVSKIKSWIEG